MSIDGPLQAAGRGPPVSRLAPGRLARNWLRPKPGRSHWIMPWPLALAIVVVLQALSLWGLQSLRLNNAPEIYYPPGSAAVVLRDALRKEFPSDEILTVVFQGDDLYTLQMLKRLDRLARQVGKHPLVDRVLSITTLEHISGTEDGFGIEKLVDVGSLGNDDPAAVQARVMSDRFAPGLLASRDGTLLAMAVRPHALSESADRLALKVAVAAAINEAGLRARYAGDAGPLTLDVAQLQSILQDSMFFIPATTVLGLGLLAWVVGRLRPVVIGAMAMATVVHPMIAAIALSGRPYTMASAILPSLLAAYTFATLLHLYAAVQRAQGSGLSRSQCVDRALSDTFKPGLFNVLTTGAGLLSLIFVPIPPIQVFGVAGALGTALVFFTVFVLTPPFLTSWDNRRWPQRGSAMGRFGRMATRMATFGMRRPKAILLTAAVALIAAFPLARSVTVESDVLAFFAPEHPVNQHVRLVESKLVGTTTLEVFLHGQGRDSLLKVATLGEIRDFQRWMESLPEVDRATSMVDLIEEMHWAMSGEDAQARTLPGSDRLLRQYLLIYDGDDLFELVDREYERGRIVVSVNVHGAKEIARVISAIRTRLAERPVPGVAIDIGGNGRLFADQVDLLVSGQLDSFVSAFAQIFLFMALLWRSVKAALICLVPNLVPLYFIFVMMGGTGIHLDLATVMIAGVVLGITVDDTIHLYHGYRHRLQAGISVPLAIVKSFQSSGRAVLAISVLLTAQFGLLATSDFIPTANFGLMTAVGLLGGQAAELLLLPALLILKDGRRRTRGASASPRSATAPPVTSETLWPAAEAPPQQPRTAPAPAASSGFALGLSQAATAPTDAARTPLVIVCRGEACRAKGADAIWQACLETYVSVKARGDGSGALPVEAQCLRRCDEAPAVSWCAGPQPVVGDELLPIRTAAAALVQGRPLLPRS